MTVYSYRIRYILIFPYCAASEALTCPTPPCKIVFIPDIIGIGHYPGDMLRLKSVKPASRNPRQILSRREFFFSEPVIRRFHRFQQH
jgi:hypothetical protein